MIVGMFFFGRRAMRPAGPVGQGVELEAVNDGKDSHAADG